MSDLSNLHSLLDEANAHARAALQSLQEARAAIFSRPETDNPTTATDTAPAQHPGAGNHARPVRIVLKGNKLRGHIADENETLDDL